MSQTTVLIADDHPVFREGLRRIIEKNPQFEIVAEAGDGNAALALIKAHRPRIAVVDMMMPGANGLAVAREALKLKEPPAIVILTMFKEEDLFNQALDLEVKGFLLKDNAVLDIVNCLRQVAAGECYISPVISQFLVDRSRNARGLAREKPGIDSLTASERRILRLISQGKTSKEIAAELFISPKTVENHRLNIAAKLDLHGNNVLLKFALENRSRL